MKEGRPSRTAERVAVRRAAHQLLDRPLVFEDPLALRIIGPELAATIEPDRGGIRQVMGQTLRALLAVRSRVAEESLAQAVELGVRQYVLLGAGLDTFAYRNPWQDLPLRVFEVDYPATQAWKQELLAAAGIPLPPTLTFAPVDFESQTLADGLAAAGWRADQPTFFAWLGVVPYLTTEAIDTTLRLIMATPGPGTGVVFDYGVRPESLSFLARLAYQAMAARVAAAGEPWLSSFDPPALVTHLGALGFSRVTDLGPDELNARYFAGRDDGLHLSPAGHLMVAWV